MKFVYQSFRWMAGAWIICFLLMPEKIAAQAQSDLYAEIDQRIKIDVPNIPLSMLEITVTGGTIRQTDSPYNDSGTFYREDERFKRHKKGVSTYWIVRPAWVLARYGYQSAPAIRPRCTS